MATAFHLLRQRLGRLTGSDNIKVGIPTGAFTTDSFEVSALAPFPDGYFDDWHGRFYAGLQKGTDFEVATFLSANGLFTIEPPVAENIKATDFFEIYKYTTPVDMGDFINLAISMVDEEALLGRVDESLTIPSTTTYEYLVPPGMAYIDKIYQEESTAGRWSAGTGAFDYRHWRILSAPARIWFDPSWVTLIKDRRLRLVGQGSQAQMVDDDDECEINEAFVIYQAKALLHESKIRGSASDFEAHDRQMVIAQSRADSERSRIQVTSMGRKV